ncbi:MAG: hypothetical protein WDZ35_03390 [Crocinitomicaceae bacterium]
MHNVTDDQIDFILDDITKKGIVTEDVKYNILDHVCCIIENEMPKGEDFYEFYRNTIARFYKNELKEIEDETVDLLTFKYYYAMKRTLKITGLLSVLLIATGVILKTQHLPGAGISLVIGFTIFSLIFIPLNIIMKYRDDKEKYNRIVMIFGMSITLVGTVGVLFKIMHWPFANLLFYGSIMVFALVFIPIYFFTRYRNPETKFNAIIHTTFMIAAAGMIMAMTNLRPSHYIADSVESMDMYQAENIKRIKDSNEKLYASLNRDNEKVQEMQQLTLKLSKLIESIKRNLIAKSNGVSEQNLKSLSLDEVDDPNDVNVVKLHFEKASGDMSYANFRQAVSDYNTGILILDESGVLRPLKIEQLQMTNTILSVVLHELADIQVQLLSNENSYLCLHKGVLTDE